MREDFDRWPGGFPEQDLRSAASGLIHRWPLVTGVGTVEPDIVGGYEGDINTACIWDATPNKSPALDFAGGVTASQVDMASDMRALTSTEPFTITWWEYVRAGYLVFTSICTFTPSGGNRFVMLRSTDTSYLNFSCGAAAGTNSAQVFSGAPSLLSSQDKWRFWALSGAGGMGSKTAGDYSLFVDGITYSVSSQQPYTALATPENRIGWDGANSRFRGALRDFRIYNRALDDNEKNAIMIERGQDVIIDETLYAFISDAANVRGPLAWEGGLAGRGGLAGSRGGLAG